MNLTNKEGCVLEMLLSADRALCAVEMVECSAGQLSRGGICVTLGRMEDKGYIEGRPEPYERNQLQLPRRLYSPTDLGESAYQHWKIGHETTAGHFT